jgi:hypothetical protein
MSTQWPNVDDISPGLSVFEGIELHFALGSLVINPTCNTEKTVATTGNFPMEVN